MAGIYIHVPFCKRICSYCDFYKSTLTAIIPEYIPAVKRELELRRTYLQNESIDTVYFGGGTPSLMSSEQIEDIIDRIKSLYPVSDDCEITVEANPDDLTAGYLSELSRTHVNRLSIGIQSFNDRDLQVLNRRHNALQALVSIEQARRAGFRNISIDLIYGIPGMTNDEWYRNLITVPEVEHISAYHLTVEPGTALFRKVREGLLVVPVEDESYAQFFTLRKFAEDRKMIHYEISNLAKEGYYSTHNTAYWQRKKYLGVGPSAHSYDQRSRQWNIRDIREYIEKVNVGFPAYESEELSEADHFNEYLMVSLRTIWGADQDVILGKFGPAFYSRLLKSVSPYLNSGHIIHEGGFYKMTAPGWLISDLILAHLIT
ncbi:radical SAM family heme chaperone HemW [bacterium]|nr:MAG: radical SAM family heme chaperone HemW [bacterium]